MAMPTSAAASAGASLTPSPTIATAPCAARSVGDGRQLVGRQQPGPHVGRRRRRRRWPAAASAMSPVSIATCAHALVAQQPHDVGRRPARGAIGDAEREPPRRRRSPRARRSGRAAARRASSAAAAVSARGRVRAAGGRCRRPRARRASGPRRRGPGSARTSVGAAGVDSAAARRGHDRAARSDAPSASRPRRPRRARVRALPAACSVTVIDHRLAVRERAGLVEGHGAARRPAVPGARRP